MNKILFLGFLILIILGKLDAQDNNIIDISLASVQDTATNNYFTVFVNIKIKEGWHLNSNKPLDEYMTPTSIRLVDSTHIKVVKIEYPPEIIAKLPFSESELSLFEGMVMIKVSLKADEVFIRSKKKAEFELEYQSCNNKTCLFPVQKILEITL